MILKSDLYFERNERKMVNDTVIKEETNENKKSKKFPKEISQEMLKKMLGSLLRAVGIMLYFIILNLAYSTMKQERLIGDIEVFAGAFLVAGIIFLERAYKNDNGSMAISGIEFLVLSLHSLSIMHVITLFKYEFSFYLLTSSYVFSIYYVLKTIVLYTKGRREYLNSLSDISEIVKKEEPVIKEAKKTKKETAKTPKADETIDATNKKTTKSKTKISNEEKMEENSNNKKKATKSKGKKVKEEKAEGTQTEKNKTTKVEAEEIKATGKKKRGRPKKEVKKND